MRMSSNLESSRGTYTRFQKTAIKLKKNPPFPINLKITYTVQFLLKMAADQDKIEAFDAPDVTQVDPLKITYFSKTAPSYRTISGGLNLEGKCNNKQCIAYQMKVWTPFQYGKFNIGQIIRKCKCPSCGKYTKGNKMFGLYQSVLTGYGMKKPDRRNSEASTNANGDTDDEQNEVETQEIKFNKLVCSTKDGFLKMDGKNGKVVKWYYMTLEIKKLPTSKR